MAEQDFTDFARGAGGALRLPSAVQDPDRSPIFVVGTGRSGTTLLRMMLGAHPRIHLTHEASFYVWESLFPHRRGGEAYLAHFLDTFSFRWLHLDPAPLVEGLPVPLTRSHYRDLYLRIMRAKAAQHGKPRFGDKTPSHSAHLGRIFRDFPDARVVRIVRDPRAVVHSLAHMPWGTSNLVAASFFCELERLQVKRWRPRILEVRLEDLVAEPRAVMERVLAFVGEPWDDAVLDHAAHTSADDLPPVPWFRAAAEAPGPDRGRWRTAYTPVEVRLLEVLNGSGLADGGYPRAEAAAGRLAVFARWVRELPGLLAFLVAFLRHARAARRGTTPESRALFRRLNPPAWTPGFEMPVPPPVSDAWRGERAAALARAGTPRTFRAEVFDRAFAAARCAGAGCVSLELTYPSGVDRERLARAIGLLVRAEPWLGCRLVHDGGRAWWEEVPVREGDLLVEVGDEQGWAELQRRPIDQDHGPLVRLGLWRGPAEDRVLLTVSHAISDGRGAVSAIEKVAAHYRALGLDPAHDARPDPTASRSLDQLRRALPWRAWAFAARNAWRRLLLDREAFPAHKLRIPDDPRRTETNYVARALDAARLRELARSRGATINDVLQACFLRALDRVEPRQGRRLTVASTVDLRRYLPGGDTPAICNFSIGQPITVGRDPGADLDATIAKVVARRGDLLGSWSGIGLEVATVPLIGLFPYAAMAEFVAANKHKLATADRPPDLFSNMGRFPEDRVVLERAPTRVLALPQFLDPPRYQLAAMGTGELVVLSSAVWPSRAREELVTRLLDAMVAELPPGTEPEPGRNLLAR